MNAEASLLAGCRLLIAEDEYLLATELQTFLEREGAIIVGMANSVARGLELLERLKPEAAVLDLNLGKELSIPLAFAFLELSVPFVILTGYGESWSRHPALRDAPWSEKPVDRHLLIGLLSQAIAGAGRCKRPCTDIGC